MGATNFRDEYEFDPETYSGQGGLVGRLQAMMQQGRVQPDVDSGSTLNGVSETNPDSYNDPQGGLLGRLLTLQAQQSQYQPAPANNGDAPFIPQASSFAQTPTSDTNSATGQQLPLRRVYIYAPTQHDAPTLPMLDQSEGTIDPSDTSSPYDSETYSGPGGLLGRLRALQAQQSQYQPIPENNEQAPFAPANPNFRQVSRAPIASWPPGAIGPSAPQAEAPVSQPQAIQLYDFNQARPAREAMPGQLAPGVRNAASLEAPTVDPIDIAKSLGIGVANGLVNTVGFPAEALTGFGYLPDHFVENPVRRMFGYPDLAADTSGLVESAKSDALRRSIEKHIGEFYQPKSRAGRYAETIGEMVPMVLGGEAAAGGKALRELPATLAKHAVAPGIVVQALEEALPESKLGQTLQKAYPVLRRGLPIAIAGTRYLGRRIVPQ